MKSPASHRSLIPWLSTALCLILCACDSPQKRALRELNDVGIPISARSLVNTVTQRDATNTTRLIAAGVHLEQRDSSGRTPLRIAVENGDHRIATALLSVKANVNATTPDNVSPLGIAVFQNETALVEKLLAAGARIDSLMPDGEKVLPWAIREGRLVFVRAMMRAGADPHLTDQAGNPLLHIAMNCGRRDVVESLLELGADPGATNPAGETTLHLALRHGWLDILPRLTAAGADPNHPGPSGKMPLEQALEARDATLLDFLLRAHADPNQRNPAGIAPLHTAIESRWFEGLAVLAKNQADFSMPDADGITPLERVFADGDRPMLEFLLENKAKPGSGGWSPWLSRAFERNDTGLARLLLSHGATPAIRHKNGHLLLEIAASHGLGDWVKLLLDFGSPTGRALHLAAARGDTRTLELLLACGVSPNHIPIPWNDHPLAVAIRNRHDHAACLLIHHGANIDLKLPEGQLPLQLAIATGCHRTVKHLLDSGADPNAPLTIPARDAFIKNVRPGIMRWALKSDRNITPLMLAADSGVHQSASHLIKAGAKTSVWTRSSRLWPVNFASRRSDVKMMRVILGQDAETEQRHIVVSLSEQRARVFDQSGNEIFSTKVSTGRRGYATRTGEFVITNKHRSWTSTIYHSSMPYFQRLSCSDFGLHQGVVPGYPASHGCIRVPAGNAAKLFSLTETGDRVRIEP